MEDLVKILYDKIKKSQALLANWHDHPNPLGNIDTLQQLNDILDNSVLSALKESAEIRNALESQKKNGSLSN